MCVINFVSNVRKYMFTCLRISITANVKRLYFCTCADRTPVFTAELSALDRNTADEKNLDCVDSLIREMTMLRNEIALIKKPEFFLTVAKNWPHRNQNDSLSSYHSATVNKKRKADVYEMETVERKLRSTEEVKFGTDPNPPVIKGVQAPRSVVICI